MADLIEGFALFLLEILIIGRSEPGDFLKLPGQMGHTAIIELIGDLGALSIPHDCGLRPLGVGLSALTRKSEFLNKKLCY